MPTVPPIGSTLGESAGVFNNVYGALQAKYADASSWANWSAVLLAENLTAITAANNAFSIQGILDTANAAINAIPAFTPGMLTPVVIGDAPGSTLDYAGSEFANELLTELQLVLKEHLQHSSTGLGDAEDALFAKETTRANAIRAAAYTEITTQFASRNWEMPPGALLAKQTEIDNESTLRLADSSAAIMSESARLAVQFNLGIITSSTQVVDVLSRIFDSKEVRAFEVEKTKVMLALEGYKSTVAGLAAKSQIEIATEAQRGQDYELSAKKATLTAQLAGTEMAVAVDASVKHLAMMVEAMRGISQSAAQIVASALGSVNVSTSYGASGQSSESLDLNTNANQIHKTQSIYYEGKTTNPPA